MNLKVTVTGEKLYFSAQDSDSKKATFNQFFELQRYFTKTWLFEFKLSKLRLTMVHMTRFFQEEFIKGRALLLLSPQSHSVHTGAKFILCTYLRYL